MNSQRDILQGLRVLVVDDEPDLREILAEDVADWGCEVLSAAGGDEAFALLCASAFDFVITDVRMPAGDGVSLLRRIVGDGDGDADTGPQVVLMSGFTDLTVGEALSLGALGVIPKPYDPDRLFELLAASLSAPGP